MRNTPLLTAPPTRAVSTLVELYTLVLMQAERTASTYTDLAMSLKDATDPAMQHICRVAELQAKRERDRIEDIRRRCEESECELPKPAEQVWSDADIDLVSSREMAEIADSAVSTPYQIWTLAVRHRQREFVFWTYIAALATDAAVQSASEELAREALSDASVLRRERRLAWRAEREMAGIENDEQGHGEMASAAMLESLLFKEVVRWATLLPGAARDELFAAAGYSVPAADLIELPGLSDADAPEDASRRAIRYAEQLTSIYLDEAGRANDQAALDLAQSLAAAAIQRMSTLRQRTFPPSIETSAAQGLIVPG